MIYTNDSDSDSDSDSRDSDSDVSDNSHNNSRDSDSRDNDIINPILKLSHYHIIITVIYLNIYLPCQLYFALTPKLCLTS